MFLPPSFFLQELAQALADQFVPNGTRVTLRTGLSDGYAPSFARVAHSFILLEHAGVRMCVILGVVVHA